MLGLYDKINPKFVKRYLSLSDPIRKAVSEYIDDVESQTFPAEEHSYHMESQT
jgi:3-methyl-2-oxobutanoate hydroxymethyltransferase